MDDSNPRTCNRSPIKRTETLTAMPLFQPERRQTMRKYLYSENGFTEKAEWQPNCWVNVECPDNDDFKFLTERAESSRIIP